MNLNELFRELEEELKRGNYTKEQKIGIINDVGNMYRNQTDKELNDYLTRQYLGTAFEIGSAAIPVGGISGQIAKKVVPAAITKTMGRKISQDVAAGAIGGAIDGAVFGVGRGLVEDENILKTAAQDGLLGLGIGSAFDGVTGKIANDVRTNETQGINQMRKYWGVPFRKASGNPQKAIDTLMENQQGFVPNVYQKVGIGNFDIPWGHGGDNGFGLSHVIERRINQGIDGEQFVKDLPDLIEKGDVYGKPRHFERGYIGDDVKEIAIRQNYKTKDKVFPRKWMTSAYKIYKNDIKNSQAAHVLRTSETVTSADRIPLQNLGINNNITDYMNKNNLPDWTSSKLTPPIVSAADKYVKDEFNIPQQNSQKQDLQKPFELRIEKRQYGNNAPIDIETPAGYSAPVEENKPGYRDLTGYKNPLSGDNRIYTAEDIGEMSGNEFGKLEKEIDAQINTIGISRKKDLGVFSGGTIYITPYTRSDGVKVRGHFRAMRSY